MKKSFLLLLSIILSISVHAQFRFGLKASMTNSGFFYPYTTNAIYTPLPKILANAGIVANYKICKWFSMQAELIYNPFSTSTKVTNDYVNFYTGGFDEENSTMKVRTQYLEIPLITKFTLFGNQKVNLDIFAGGFIARRIASVKQHLDHNPAFNANSDYTTLNAGFTSGIGLSIMQQRMFFDIRTTRGLMNIHPDSEDFKITTVQGACTVGYYLFRGKKK